MNIKERAMRLRTTSPLLILLCIQLLLHFHSKIYTLEATISLLRIEVSIQPTNVVKLSILQLLLLSVVVSAQTNYTIRPSVSYPVFRGIRLHSPDHASQPKVGLVLSGGGARGLAQIGVLRVLEEHHIPIDLIVGNSFGSVVGGLYSSGYTIAEIESVALHTNWSELLSFSEETKRSDLFVGQKQSQQQGYLEIRFDGLQPIIPSSISGGQRLSNFFSYLALQALYHPNPSFDDLKIPFRAIATDLLTGKRIILDRGSVAEAMRASVTVPLLYSPIERDSMYLVDGGLTSNIPADVARSLGCDVVIVVNSTSSMRNSSQLTAPWEIADQIMTIMMQEANERELKLADVVITPAGASRIVSDFSGVDSLISVGERSAEQSIPKILDVLNTRTSMSSSLSADSLNGVRLTFAGDPITEDIQREIMGDADRKSISPRSIEETINRLYAGGNYRDVYAEVQKAKSPAEVSYHATVYPSLSDIRFSGNKLISDETINREIFPFKGRTPRNESIQQTLETVLSLYRREGYSLARIESVRIDADRGRLDFTINEGTIAQIRYEGNTRTRDYIIRREFPMDEGTVFSIDNAYRGIVNIKSTGLFDYVLLDVRYSGNQPVIVIRVKEKSAGLLRLGIHADNEHSLVNTIDIRDENFRGAWETFGLRARYGYRDRQILADYMINRIFNTYLTLNSEAYFTSRDVNTYRDDPTLGSSQWDRIEFGKYKVNKYGWSLAFGSQVERFGNVVARLRIENHQIASIDGEGYVPERYQFVSLKLQSTIDTEDKFIFPTEGMFFTLSYESAMRNLGSEVGFGKFGFTYETYLTLLPHHTLRPRVTFGFADATLPIAEQFTLGGFNSFLGLQEDDSYGRQLFLVNMEYRYELPFKIIFDTYLKARYDLGTISLVPEELKFNSFRHGLGIDVALNTPLGEASFGMGKSFYFRQDLPKSPVSTGPLLFYFSVGPNL